MDLFNKNKVLELQKEMEELKNKTQKRTSDSL